MEPSSTPEQCVEMAGHWLELGYLKFLPESPSSFQSAPSAWYRVPKKREEGETVVAAPSTGPSLADSQSMSLPKEEKKKTKKAVKPHLEGLTTEQLKQVILDTYDAMDQSSQERVVVELFARQKQNAAQQRTVEKKKEEKEKKEKKQKPEKEKKEKKQKPEKEKKDKDSSKETAPAAPVPTYFNLTLLEVMNKERERDEKALVPAVAPFLTNAIVKGGGLGCEGLFRISVFKNDLEDLEQQIESIDQEEWGEKISFETPHHPAALLKGWLRSFPEPVVPFEVLIFFFFFLISSFSSFSSSFSSSSSSSSSSYSPLLPFSSFLPSLSSSHFPPPSSMMNASNVVKQKETAIPLSTNSPLTPVTSSTTSAPSSALFQLTNTLKSPL